MGNETGGCAEVRRPICQCLPMKVTEQDLGDEYDDLLDQDEKNQEVYIECKQEMLGAHFLPTDRLRISWRSVYTIFDDHSSITELELALFLGNNKLLQSVYKKDPRWSTFYQFFATRSWTTDSDTETDL